jgi:4-oxalocrotonate tautomerase
MTVERLHNSQLPNTALRTLTAFVRVAGGNPESVTIILHDVEKEDWGAAGALMADKYPG